MLTEPYDASKIRLNTIGGTNWKIPGDKITWDLMLTMPATTIFQCVPNKIKCAECIRAEKFILMVKSYLKN